MEEIIIATSNKGKVREAQEILKKFKVIPMSEIGVNIDVEEDGKTFNEGDYLSLDGSTGNVYGEQIKTIDPEISGDFQTFMGWADSFRTLKIRTNADTPRDANQAVIFGAEGIRLPRSQEGAAILRPQGQALPAGPLRARNLSEVRQRKCPWR